MSTLFLYKNGTLACAMDASRCSPSMSNMIIQGCDKTEKMLNGNKISCLVVTRPFEFGISDLRVFANEGDILWLN